MGAKTVAQQARFSREYRLRLTLVGCQGANKDQNLRNIFRGGCANRGSHVYSIVGCDRCHTRTVLRRIIMDLQCAGESQRRFLTERS